MEGLSTSVQYEETIWREFVHRVHTHTKTELVLVHSVQGIKQAGLDTFGTKSHETRACPLPYGMKSHKESLPMSVRYEKSSRLDFIRPIHSHAIGGHVFVHPV